LIGSGVEAVSALRGECHGKLIWIPTKWLITQESR